MIKENSIKLNSEVFIIIGGYNNGIAISMSYPNY